MASAPSADLAPYVIAQCLAAAAGALVILLKTDEAIVPLALAVVPALIAEFLFTFALCYVVLNTATAKANAGNSYFGLAIGFTVLAGAFAVGSVSHAAFNPAVAVALGVMGLVEWADLWIHLVGEVAGAVLAALTFKGLVSDQS